MDSTTAISPGWSESQYVSGSDSHDSMKVLGEGFTTCSHGSSGDDGLSSCHDDTPNLSMSEFSFSRSSSATVPLITSASLPPPSCQQPSPGSTNCHSIQGGRSLHNRQLNTKDTRPWIIKTLSSWKCHIPSSFKTECKELVDIAWPVIITQFLQFTLQLTSAVFCGHLGRVYLDAIALGNMVLNTCGISVLIGLGCACDTLFAQTFGSANKKNMGVVLQKGCLILLLSCLPCWALLINTENILLLTGQDRQIASLAGQFAVVSVPVLPGEALHLILTKYLQSQSIVVPSMVIFFVVNLANFGLHAVLIFGMDLGVVGSAISISLSHWLLFVLHLLFIKASRVHEPSWNGWDRGCFYDWGQFLRLALPGLVMVCLQWWCFEVFTVLAGLLSAEELAAHSIVYQLGAFLFMAPLGLSVSVCIRVGNCLGAGNSSAAVNCAKAAIALSLIWSLGMAALFLAIKDFCPYAFTNNKLVSELASSLVPIMCLLQIGDAIQCVGAGVVLGCGGQRIGAVINLVTYYCIATPLASILMFKTSLRIVGAWWGLTACTSCQALAFILVLLNTDWTMVTAEAQVRAGIQAKHAKCTAEEDSSVSVVENQATCSSAQKTDDEHEDGSVDGNVNQSYEQEYQYMGSAQYPEGGTSVGVESLPHVEMSSCTTELSVKQLVIRRCCAFAACILVLGAGVVVNLSVGQSNSLDASCILVSGSEVNETWLSFQIHHRESFQKMSAEDQKLLNLTFWYEMTHHWNKTFLYCGGDTALEPDTARPAQTFNLTRLYSHLAMVSRPSG